MLGAALLHQLGNVEDHYAEGGLGAAVLEAVGTGGVAVHRLAVRELPRSAWERLAPWGAHAFDRGPLVFDWTLDLFFSKDLVQFKTRSHSGALHEQPAPAPNKVITPLLEIVGASS